MLGSSIVGFQINFSCLQIDIGNSTTGVITCLIQGIEDTTTDKYCTGNHGLNPSFQSKIQGISLKAELLFIV